METEKRTERLEIRLTPQEKADLREQAETMGMTITELVVYRCLRYPEWNESGINVEGA